LKWITENHLRLEIGCRGDLREYELPEGASLTPSARTFLADRKIRLAAKEGKDKTRRAKKEHETHLDRERLVLKTDPRIAFRGKLDSLEAKIILAQARIAERSRDDLAADLGDVLHTVREILRSEVLGIPFKAGPLMEMTVEEIHEASHHPQEAFGVPHFMPEHGMGEDMALLNWIRTDVRETELAACAAFSRGSTGEDVGREDIVMGLNRLSSAVYVMMCRLKSGRFYGRR
jgi:ethanolamine utilization cobalamin adenosyltransferase